MTIYVVRHGQTVANREKRRLGRGDSPLTPVGIEQALAFADAIAEETRAGSDVAIETSPLPRARHTAALIADRLGLSAERCRVSPLLIERDFGRWEGLSREEIVKRFPKAVEAQRRARWTWVVPDGESYEQVHRRACKWLAQPHQADFTIAVTHAKTSRTLRGAYLGLAPAEILALKHPQDHVFALREGRIDAICCSPRLSHSARPPEEAGAATRRSPLPGKS